MASKGGMYVVQVGESNKSAGCRLLLFTVHWLGSRSSGLTPARSLLNVGRSVVGPVWMDGDDVYSFKADSVSSSQYTLNM